MGFRKISQIVSFTYIVLAGAACAQDDIAKTSDTPEWPLPSLNKEIRLQDIKTFIEGRDYLDNSLFTGHTSAITEEYCTKLFNSFRENKDYQILNPAFVTQNINSSEAQAVIGSCPGLYLDRGWASADRAGGAEGYEEWFNSLPADERDKHREGHRYTANFEFYDLSQYGLPEGTWAVFAEGAIKSCPQNARCPHVYFPNDPTGYARFYPYNTAALFNNKTCEITERGLTVQRLNVSSKSSFEYEAYPAFYGLAKFDEELAWFSFVKPPYSGKSQLQISKIIHDMKTMGGRQLCIFEVSDKEDLKRPDTALTKSPP